LSHRAGQLCLHLRRARDARRLGLVEANRDPLQVQTLAQQERQTLGDRDEVGAPPRERQDVPGEGRAAFDISRSAGSLLGGESITLRKGPHSTLDR